MLAEREADDTERRVAADIRARGPVAVIGGSARALCIRDSTQVNSQKNMTGLQILTFVKIKMCPGSIDEN